MVNLSAFTDFTGGLNFWTPAPPAVLEFRIARRVIRFAVDIRPLFIGCDSYVTLIAPNFQRALVCWELFHFCPAAFAVSIFF